MKSVQFFLRLLSITLLLFVGSIKVLSQDSEKDKNAGKIQKKLESKNFVFVAQSVTPPRGTVRQLTSTYDVRVSNDSVICDLPYFGRAFTAPIDPAAAGIKFTSTSYDYTITPRKKGGWDVLIKPKDVRDVQQLFLNVFSNGSASLQAISNSKQPISYSGIVK